MAQQSSGDCSPRARKGDLRRREVAVPTHPARRRSAGWLATLFLVAAPRGAVVSAVCSPAGRGTPKLKRGGTTYVCLVLAKALDWGDPENEQHFVRAAFELKVDEYAQVRLRNAWSPDLQRKLNSTDVALSMQSETRVSYQKRWRAEVDGKPVTFPFLSILIKLDQGDVEQLIWDDGCYDCGGGKCEENAFEYDGSKYRHAESQCLVDDADCADGDDVAALCDLRVFVSWTGTDKHGNALLSHQFRFSRFEPISVEKYVQDLRKEDSVKVVRSSSSA